MVARSSSRATWRPALLTLGGVTFARSVSCPRCRCALVAGRLAQQHQRGVEGGQNAEEPRGHPQDTSRALGLPTTPEDTPKTLQDAPKAGNDDLKEHLRFRNSMILMVLTVGLLAVMFAFFHDEVASVLEGREVFLFALSGVCIVTSVRQIVLTKMIDQALVDRT